MHVTSAQGLEDPFTYLSMAILSKGYKKCRQHESSIRMCVTGTKDRQPVFECKQNISDLNLHNCFLDHQDSEADTIETLLVGPRNNISDEEALSSPEPIRKGQTDDGEEDKTELSRIDSWPWSTEPVESIDCTSNMPKSWKPEVTDLRDHINWGSEPSTSPPPSPYSPHWLESVPKKTLWRILQRVMEDLEACNVEFIRKKHLDKYGPTYQIPAMVPGLLTLWESNRRIIHMTDRKEFPGITHYSEKFDFGRDRELVIIFFKEHGIVDNFRHMIVHRSNTRGDSPFQPGSVEAVLEAPSLLGDNSTTERLKRFFSFLEARVKAGDARNIHHEEKVKNFIRPPSLRAGLGLDLIRSLQNQLEKACFDYARRKGIELPKANTTFEEWDLGFWCEHLNSGEFYKLDKFLTIKDLRNTASHGMYHGWEHAKGNTSNERMRTVCRKHTIEAIKFAIYLGDAPQAFEMELAWQRWSQKISRETAYSNFRAEKKEQRYTLLGAEIVAALHKHGIELSSLRDPR